MKYLLIIFITTISQFCAIAQNNNTKIKKTEKHTLILTDLDLRKEGGVSKDKWAETSQLGSMIKDFNIEVNHGDLILKYKIKSDKKRELYTIKINSIRNLSDTSFFSLQPEYVYGQIFDPIFPKKKKIESIVFANPPDNENYKYLDGNFQIELETELMEIKKYRWNVDCDCPPKFNFWLNVPIHFGIAAIGGYIWWDGYEHYEKKSIKIYEEQYANQNTEIEAAPFYKEANRLHNQFRDRRAIGASIAGVSIVSFLIRWPIIHSARKNSYKKYCTGQDDISVAPYYENNVIEHSGINLTLNF